MDVAPSSTRKPDISIVGAGIAGLWQALTFARAGYAVTLYERGDGGMAASTSHWAGGMLAPWCEREAAEDVIVALGSRSLALWRAALPDVALEGSLVVAHSRDRADFERFAAMTDQHRRLDAAALAALEPALEGRFREGLFFAGEGHVEPRRVMPVLRRLITEAGAEIRFGAARAPGEIEGLAAGGWVIDCRGLAARDEAARAPASGLRGVKGETVLVETGEITLSRPVRLLHPRWPLYVVPRAENRFLIGATTIETEGTGVSLRSALELMSAAYALHPAFAEARIVELGAALRPAFPDNRPRIARHGRIISVNGLYRHGFLIAPALAELTLGLVARPAAAPDILNAHPILEEILA
ncbi:FAD-dependent oxidoreductase [Phreatobacter sp. AB_2022a]|uniref:FAD-dependent oxidoreductase n=1 Tax=Phreatobacter sp. AB_2022a TaxID=3003134 RepID=UPI00228700AC|nr:FAD-dependent oxidoreductase [Phreatobacter sp. AB_2022a]MCZ0733847.1 FAD-dependent oxidoreductase [Phreatobacter sp. AB_2022a]